MKARPYPPGYPFGLWRVVREAEPRVSGTNRHRRMVVRCVCGVERTVELLSLRAGYSGSCGRCPAALARRARRRGVTQRIIRVVAVPTDGPAKELLETDAGLGDSGPRDAIKAGVGHLLRKHLGEGGTVVVTDRESGDLLLEVIVRRPRREKI